MARSDVLGDNFVPKSVEGNNLSEGREDAGKRGERGGGSQEAKESIAGEGR